ncbi:hypothetical protein NPIL_206241 [Nephila pilipes]|uniref:Uncharacterized protein n=1 Tax=Nephila pilipes TaxID=299642 RepID=A0A8X6UJU0_NEPPI|nr:hypothetical protein NPIL_206241 [Nephila pilipes]
MVLLLQPCKLGYLRSHVAVVEELTPAFPRIVMTLKQFLSLIVLIASYRENTRLRLGTPFPDEQRYTRAAEDGLYIFESQSSEDDGLMLVLHYPKLLHPTLVEL